MEDSLIVESFHFISKEEALARFERDFPQLEGIVRDLKENPFPASYEIVFKKGIDSPYAITSFLEEMKELEGIEEIQFNREWLEKLIGISRIIRAIGFFLGGILILASFFIISNVININVYARQNEIEIFHLIGATNSFIKIPFIIEGIMLGLFGGIFSLFLLFVSIKSFPVYLGNSYSFIKPFIVFSFLSIKYCIGLLIGGGIIGLIGSLSSVGKFLKT
ncbi:permease-like cell division protein FtsX [Candidatus Aminicenantes bacterium AC-335-A11]|nr:permease-like cell division protein FtsX [SCandidatus Aminicenantes bacterium Aminicenantia_JdfR_composite]MCP2597378.1 permease-like cell division protein FtsX [Candidatus Aminicenantes bacterium AC-335-G13]MCP2618924.1 permease-like cell division protein FtsX [Candidatus Aminicenantes bacterium AC-335-A11]